ncbi:MAG: hypothetical protein AB1644_03805 [Candidatus Zixiibacteriota bacterium]
MKVTAPNFEIINFSAELLAKPSPASTSTDCKFVIITNGEQRWFVYGAVKEYPYHANLVERFSVNNHLKYRWHRGKDRVEFSDNGYRVEGGGHLEIDTNAKGIRVSGSSKAYGSFDQSSLKQWLKVQTLLTGFKVRFGA